MWNKETVEALIINYQQHENLYNAKNPLYLDRVKRSNSIFAICQELKKFNKNITPEDVKKKIHTIRASYIKETHLISDSKKSAVGADDVYIPKLWYFPLLAFLKPHILFRKPESNISKQNISETDESDTGTETSATNKAQHPCRKRKNSFNIKERINDIQKMIAAKSQEKSCYDWLGKQVVFEITKLKNQQIQSEAVWSIQQILRQSSLEDAETERKVQSLEEEKHNFSQKSTSVSKENATDTTNHWLAEEIQDFSKASISIKNLRKTENTEDTTSQWFEEEQEYLSEEPISTINLNKMKTLKSTTRQWFELLAKKTDESKITAEQKNDIEFAVSSVVYTKLAEFLKQNLNSF